MINLEISNITQTIQRLKLGHKTYEIFKTRKDSNPTLKVKFSREFCNGAEVVDRDGENVYFP